MSEKEQDIVSRRDWRQNVMRSGETERMLDEHLRDLDITIDHLGTDILDIGSSLGEGFAREISQYGKRVFSVNPLLALPEISSKKYIDEELVGLIYNLPTITNRTVAAYAQELPFPDNTFDSVISFWAVPFYLKEYDLLQHSLVYSEMYRVLKPGKRAYVGPINAIDMLFHISKVALTADNIPHQFREGYKGAGYNLTIIKPSK